MCKINKRRHTISVQNRNGDKIHIEYDSQETSMWGIIFA